MTTIQRLRHKLTHIQSGMSLIEIIVSIFIILVIFNLCLMEINALTISKKQRHENIAYHIANKKMEDLRATPFASLPSSGTISDLQLTQIPSGSGNFTVNNYTGYTGVKELVVTVNWSDGNSKSVVIKTLAGNGGINP